MNQKQALMLKRGSTIRSISGLRGLLSSIGHHMSEEARTIDATLMADERIAELKKIAHFRDELVKLRQRAMYLEDELRVYYKFKPREY